MKPRDRSHLIYGDRLTEMDSMRAARRRQQRLFVAGILGFWLAFAFAVLMLLLHPEVIGAWLGSVFHAMKVSL